MHFAAQALQTGQKQDLSAFRKTNAEARHTWIEVRDVSVCRTGGNGDLVYVEVEASWFVYGMMRLLAATLVQVGIGAISVAQFVQIVREGRREEVNFSAPPNGLCLLKVVYPDELDPFGEAEGMDGASQVLDLISPADCP